MEYFVVAFLLSKQSDWLKNKTILFSGAITSDPVAIDPISHISIKEENEDGFEDSETKNPLYGCPECQKMFKNIGEVEKHIRTHHDSDVTENVVRLV